jgi:hypothetical protein
MNPIEDLIGKFRLLGQPSDAGDESQEWTYRKCADLLEAAIKPYRRVPGPPTEPGEYRMTFVGRNEPFIWKVTQNDIDDGIIQYDEGSALKKHIEWHARVMPPSGERSE